MVNFNPTSSSGLSYDKLSLLDVNNDHKVTGQEVLFLGELDKIIEKGEPVDRKTLETLVKDSFKSPKTQKADQKAANEFLSKLFKDYEKKDINTFSTEDAKIPTKDNKIQLGGINLAEKVLKHDGNRIDGVEDDVTKAFMAGTDKKGNIHAFKSGHFNPNKFEFDFIYKKKVGKTEIQIDRTYTDGEKYPVDLKNRNQDNKNNHESQPIKWTNSKGEPEQYHASFAGDVPKLRDYLKGRESVIGGQKMTFEAFAKNKGINLGKDFNPKHLDLLREFVTNIPDRQERLMFVSSFLTGYFVHSGQGFTSKKGMTEKNFENVLAKPNYPREQDTGRRMVDCQIYAAMTGRLLADQPGQSQDFTIRPIVIDKGETTGENKAPVFHQLAIIEDKNPENPKYYMQDNNQIFEVTKDDMDNLKSLKIKVDNPPNDEQILKAYALKYIPPEKDDITPEKHLQNISLKGHNPEGNIFKE